MTTQAQPAAPAKPDVMPQERAYEVLQGRVYVPVFLNKLASDYGIVPRTDAEVASLLRAAGRLRNAFNAKQASATNPINALDAKLDEVLGDDQPNPQIKQASVQAFNDAELRAAAMSLNIHAANAQASA